MKVDFKSMKPSPKMVDPCRFPKVILPLEKEMKDSYELQLNKMVVDVTKLMTKLKK